MKSFDCIPHDHKIAKLNAYGLGFDTVTFLFLCLKERNQGRKKVSIHNISSLFEIILSGVPQGSILGPIVFNTLLNDLFFNLRNKIYMIL